MAPDKWPQPGAKVENVDSQIDAKEKQYREDVLRKIEGDVTSQFPAIEKTIQILKDRLKPEEMTAEQFTKFEMSIREFGNEIGSAVYKLTESNGVKITHEEIREQK